MPGKHALLAPSGADRWMACPGSVVLCEGLRDSGSEYSDEGTAAHFLAAECLGFGDSPAAFLKRHILVPRDLLGDSSDPVCWTDSADDPLGRVFTVDIDMARYVNLYISFVREQAEGQQLFVETRVPIGQHTGEDGASGTADAIVIRVADKELQVHDLKYGQGEIVRAENNKQEMLYALGAYDIHSMAEDIETIRLFIHQPRIHAVPEEWSCTVEELMAFAASVKTAAMVVDDAFETDDIRPFLHPGEKQCRWCLTKPCKAYSIAVAEAVKDDFEVEETTAILENAEPTPELLDLVEKWVKAKRADIERKLFEGVKLAHWKLVQGREGNRAWSNTSEAETTLKSMRLKVEEMYAMSLISPTSAEKIFGSKGTAPSVKRWNKLQALIVRPEGKASVAPMSDPRSPLDATVKAGDFGAHEPSPEDLA